MELPLLKRWLAQTPGGRPELHVVGGAVRDLVMGKVPKDVDLVCRNARGLALRMSKSLKLALVPMEKKPEEPCYRVVERNDPSLFLDIAELKGRDIEDDLKHRDFTINSLAVHILPDGSLGEIIDPLGGLDDIKQRIIRKTSVQSFKSDPLRVLRAVRLSAQLGFAIEQSTLHDLEHYAALLKHVAPERILSELLYILDHPRSSNFFREMDRCRILDVLFPEIIPMKNCEQNAYHHLGVWEHSLLAMEQCEYILGNLDVYFGTMKNKIIINIGDANRSRILKFSAMFHDIGKPAVRCFTLKGNRWTFHLHDKRGSQITDAIGERLKMSNRDSGLLSLLVREHRHVRDLAKKGVKTSTIMRWFRRLGQDGILVLILSMADANAKQGAASLTQDTIEYLSWCEELVRKYYTSLKNKLEMPPLINGNDLISLGLEPGPALGKVLAKTKEAQDLGLFADRDGALIFAQEIMSGKS